MERFREKGKFSERVRIRKSRNRGDGDSAEEKEEAGCRDRVGKREKKSQKLFMVFFFALLI